MSKSSKGSRISKPRVDAINDDELPDEKKIKMEDEIFPDAVPPPAYREPTVEELLQQCEKSEGMYRIARDAAREAELRAERAEKLLESARGRSKKEWENSDLIREVASLKYDLDAVKSREEIANRISDETLRENAGLKAELEAAAARMAEIPDIEKLTQENAVLKKQLEEALRRTIEDRQKDRRRVDELTRKLAQFERQQQLEQPQPDFKAVDTAAAAAAAPAVAAAAAADDQQSDDDVIVVVDSSPHSTSPRLLCELCDKVIRVETGYREHLKVKHQEVTEKSASNLQCGAFLACSHCRDRFWTYEGLERHLLMSHGLVTAEFHAKAKKKEDGGRCRQCATDFGFNILLHLAIVHAMELKSAVMSFSCNVCAFNCQGHQEYEEHFTLMHSEKDDGTSETTQESKPRSCKE